MVLSRYMRFYSAEEIRPIADRIDRLVKRDRIVRLRPETAWIVEKAVRAYAARPNPRRNNENVLHDRKLRSGELYELHGKGECSHAAL